MTRAEAKDYLANYRRMYADLAPEKMLDALDVILAEQPEVDLEEIIVRTYHDGSVADTDDMDHIDYGNIARYFFELGQKDAANKYDEIKYNRQRAQEQEGQR